MNGVWYGIDPITRRVKASAPAEEGGTGLQSFTFGREWCEDRGTPTIPVFVPSEYISDFNQMLEALR